MPNAVQQAGQAELPASEDTARAEQHDQHQHDRVGQHTVGGEITHQLRQAGQECRTDDRAGQRARAADDDFREQLCRIVEVEVCGDHRGHVVGVDAAADARKERRDRKGQYLVVGHVDARGRRRNVILADGLHRAAKAAAHKQKHNRHADDHDPECAVKRGKLENTAHRLAAARNGKVAETDADNLGKSHRNDSQIVAPQPQCRDADCNAHKARGQAARQNRNEQQRQIRKPVPGQRTGHDSGHIRPHRDKARMTHRELTHKAHDEVERRDHDDRVAGSRADALDVSRAFAEGVEGKSQRDGRVQQRDTNQIQAVGGQPSFRHFVHAPLHFFTDILAQNTGRLHQQNHDQRTVGHGLVPAGGKQLDKNFNQADQDTSQHRAGDDSDAAQHGGDKRLHAHHTAHIVRDAGIGGAVHQRRHRRQARADGKCRCDDSVDVDADESGRILILRHGTHRLAELRLFDEKLQGNHNAQANGNRQQYVQRQGHAAHGDGGQAEDGLYVVGLGTKQYHGQVLQKDAHSQRRDQCGHRPCLAHGAVGKGFDQYAHQRAYRNSNDNRKPCGHPGVDHQRDGVEQRVCADHDKVTVGEVDHADNAVDHCVAQGNQRINCALV